MPSEDPYSQHFNPLDNTGLEDADIIQLLSCDRHIRVLRAVIRIDVTLEMVDDLAQHLQEVGLPNSSSQPPSTVFHACQSQHTRIRCTASSALKSPDSKEGLSCRVTPGATE